MLWPKKIHTRNLITEKIPAAREFPSPPHITYLMVRPLHTQIVLALCNGTSTCRMFPGGVTWVNICSVCATCLSEPRLQENPFPILNTFGKLNAIFAIPT